MSEETTSVLVSGLKTPTTAHSEQKSLVHHNSLTLPQPFYCSSGASAPGPPTVEYDPIGYLSRIVCSDQNLNVKQDNGNGSNQSSENSINKTVSVHPAPENCNRITTNDQNIEVQPISQNKKNSLKERSMLEKTSDDVQSLDHMSLDGEEEGQKKEETESSREKLPGLEETEGGGAVDGNNMSDSKNGDEEEVKTVDKEKNNSDNTYQGTDTTCSQVDNVLQKSRQKSGAKKLENPLDINGGINGNECSSEEDPLLNRNKRKTYYRKVLMCAVVVLVTVILCFLVLCGLLPVLYVSNVFAVRSRDSNQTTLALSGDYVLLPYDVKRGTMYKYNLVFSMPSEYQAHTVDVYSIRCDDMWGRVIKTKNFQLKKTQDLSLVPQLTRIYFDSCSEYKGKCVLGEFVYQAKSRVTEMNFNITINNFTARLTKIQILAYDNYEEVMNFLENDVRGNPVKSVEMNSENYLFIFNNEQMKESSYFFFVIQDVMGTTEWYTANRVGLHVYYNASSLSPYCTMNSTNNFTCSMADVDDNDRCFIGCVRVQKKQEAMVTGSSPTKENTLFYISHQLNDPMPTGKGLAIIWGTYSFVLCVVLIMIASIIIPCAIFCCRKNGSKHALSI